MIKETFARKFQVDVLQRWPSPICRLGLPLKIIRQSASPPRRAVSLKFFDRNSFSMLLLLLLQQMDEQQQPPTQSINRTRFLFAVCVCE